MITHLKMRNDTHDAISADLASERLSGQMLANLLDLLTLGIIVTDSDARIVYLNRRGSILLHERRSLRDSKGKLSAANPRCAWQLRLAIAECANASAPKAQAHGIPLFISSEQDGEDLSAWILPLLRGGGFASGQAAIIIRDGLQTFSQDCFACRYGATAAEVRVMEMLMDGMVIEEISAALGISNNTVKTHLRSLFAKTGTSRQADLVRIASTAFAPATWGHQSVAWPAPGHTSNNTH